MHSATMKLYPLTKTVLRLRGDPTKFLNGLTSNTLDKPQNAFLNIHGRIIATFEQVKINEEEFWLIVEARFVEGLLKHIDRYVRLSKVEILPMNAHVYFDIAAQESDFPEGTQTIAMKNARMVVSADVLDAPVTQEQFTFFRLKNWFPLQGIDYSEEFILNIGAEDFVSFSKGCFLGQEPVAKVHNRSRPTWRLVVKYEDECEERLRTKMTSKVLDPGVNRVLGFIFIENQ